MVQFYSQHQKNYATEQESNLRFSIFKDNLDTIERHNNHAALGKKTFTLRMNHLGDLSKEEYKQMRGFKPSKVLTSARPANWGLEAPPSAVDWREKKAVSFVKDQGQCGSCWSFSTTGAIEGAHVIANNPLVSLSEQNIIDCTWDLPYNNTGCDGGDMRTAMQYVIDNKGLDIETSYPYVDYNGGDREKCKFNAANVGATMSSMVNVIEKNETDLALATARGPVSVAIDASLDSFQFYDSGVYYDVACHKNLDDLDHGVLVIGYTSSYWIVKNSWGNGWGQNGYIWVAKGYNACGIATYGTLPLI